MNFSNSKKVSFVLSCFNAQNTISKSIDSILNQTYKNIEILLMDDGSTDDTYEICNDYAKKNSQIILFRNHLNIGLTKSLNILYKESSGDFIARQDADDYSHKDRIEKQLDFITNNNLDGCTTRAEIIGTKKAIPGLSRLLPINFVLKYKNPFIHGSLLLKKNTLYSINGYDERFVYAQDYKLMKDLITSNCKISIMNKTLYFLNMNDNISSNFKSEQAYFADCVRKGISP
tara:strand:- start:5164 stop:5856 length:693 start_codon:yes stop_codon:yes gene_type:complete